MPRRTKWRQVTRTDCTPPANYPRLNLHSPFSIMDRPNTTHIDKMHVRARFPGRFPTKAMTPCLPSDKIRIMPLNPPAIILLSGGLDSATCLAIARHDGFSPLYSMSFDYGQRHR